MALNHIGLHENKLNDSPSPIHRFTKEELFFSWPLPSISTCARVIAGLPLRLCPKNTNPVERYIRHRHILWRAFMFDHFDWSCLLWQVPITLTNTGTHKSSNALFYLQLQKDIKIYFNQYLTAHDDALAVRKLGILDSDVPEVDLLLTCKLWLRWYIAFDAVENSVTWVWYLYKGYRAYYTALHSPLVGASINYWGIF